MRRLKWQIAARNLRMFRMVSFTLLQRGAAKIASRAAHSKLVTSNYFVELLKTLPGGGTLKNHFI